MESKFIYLVSGITLILIISSIIAAVLKRKFSSGEKQKVIENLNARINSWWLMVGFLVAAYLLGDTITITLFMFISFFAFREFITLTPTKVSDYRTLFICFYLLIPGQYLTLYTNWYGLMVIFIPVYAFLFLPAVSALAGDVDGFLDRSARIQWAIMIAIYCISYAPALLLLEIKGYEQNRLLLFYLLLVVQMSDVLQYVFGKLYGKKKLAPIVSPSKTVEGLIYGGFSASIVGALMWWITPFSIFESFLISLLIVIMGFLGGLALSAIKRSLGAKDWGTMIHGHGGMLDRMDSVCFSAPIFFHIVRYFYT